jgi:hypothetical protein
VSGSHHVSGPRPSNGGYRAPDPGDGYRTSGGYRTNGYGGDGNPSGPYPYRGRSRSGSGSHRAAGADQRWGWRMAMVLCGAVVGVAACAMAIVLIMNRTTGTKAAASKAAQPSAQTSAANGERTVVPDSCSMIANADAAKLVPNFTQTPSTASDTDTYSQCAWTDFAAGSGRQLTVEVRALVSAGGKSGVELAKQTFQSEASGDASGKNGLDATQTVVAHEPLSGLGNEAYVTYSTDSSQAFGDGGVNIRLGNTLLSVHFGGSDGGPLSQQKATAGVTDAARKALKALETRG